MSRTPTLPRLADLPFAAQRQIGGELTEDGAAYFEVRRLGGGLRPWYEAAELAARANEARRYRQRIEAD